MITVIEFDKSGGVYDWFQLYDWKKPYVSTMDEAVKHWVNLIGTEFPKHLARVAFFDNSDVSDVKVMSADELKDRWEEINAH